VAESVLVKKIEKGCPHHWNPPVHVKQGHWSLKPLWPPHCPPMHKFSKYLEQSGLAKIPEMFRVDHWPIWHHYGIKQCIPQLAPMKPEVAPKATLSWDQPATMQRFEVSK